MSAIRRALVQAIKDSARHDGWTYATDRDLANLIGSETNAADGKFYSVRTQRRNLVDGGWVEQRFDEFTRERKLKVVREPD